MYDGEKVMGNAVYEKDLQLKYLKDRLNMLLHVIDSLDPESTDLEDIERLIEIVHALELKYEQFKKNW
jgi:ribosome biogenesis GTPase A